MKLCYCDESGTGDEPIAVMVGVVVDAQRMHITKIDWRALLNTLSQNMGIKIDELHTRDFYAGNSYWRSLKGEIRAEIIEVVFQWIQDRRHDVVFTSVDKVLFEKSRRAGQIPSEINSVWKFMGLHLLLSVQKAHQRLKKTKGHTIFVFDNEERERMRFTDLIANSPAWADSYYSKEKRQARLDQIVDVPYFGDSKEVGLLQLADFIAFFLRRHAEIAAGNSKERYELEAERISRWISSLKKCCFPPSFIYPVTGRCECSNLFYSHAPQVLRDLHRE